MRQVTRQIALEPGGWTAERRSKVATLFDGLAETWNSRDVASRGEALLDALDRGGPFGLGPCLEVGAGTGAFTPKLVDAFDSVVGVDLSGEMLRRATQCGAALVQADSATLPFRDSSAAALVLLNMFLFPDEVERVLAPDGCLLWVSALGDRTPIYLSAEDVDDALPGEWEGVGSDAGWGSWAVFRRARAGGG